MSDSILTSILRKHKLVVFSKTYCPGCYKVKQLFCSLGIDPVILELDLIEGGSEIQQALVPPTGSGMVPKVWISGLWFDSDTLFQFYADNRLIPHLKSIGIPIIT